MPSHYVVICNNCNYEEERYRNVKKCPKCNGILERKDRMICRICRDEIEEDHPETVYTWNPETNRLAIMHYWCALHAYEHLTQEQKEKYLQLDEGLKK